MYALGTAAITGQDRKRRSIFKAIQESGTFSSKTETAEDLSEDLEGP